MTIDLDPCIALHQAGRLDEAIRCYRRALPRDRGGVQVNRLLGVALFAKGDLRDALKHLQAALARAPGDAALLNDTGNALRALGRRAEAAQAFRRAIATAPDALFNLADTLLELDRPAEALDVYRAILARRPDGMDADFHNNHGACLMALDRAEEALAAFRQALALDAAHPGALTHMGAALQVLGRPRESVEHLRDAARRHGATLPLLVTLGHGLLDQRDLPPALETFAEVLRHQPGHHGAMVGQAIALSGLKRHAEAIAAIGRAIAAAPAERPAHIVAGNIHLAAGDLPAAVAAYARAAALPAGRRPDAAAALLTFTRLRVCDWTGFDTARTGLVAGFEAGTARLPPFEALALADDPGLHRRTAAHHARTSLPARRDALPVRREATRLRIGYVSGELRMHAVGHLMARLLECHDRDGFEVHAISLGRLTGDPVQARIRAAVDGFHDAVALTDDALVAMARGLRIDIAIDLNGYTGDSRGAVLARGIAPVQVGFLGYPGTSGGGFLDYIIADATVIPPGAEADWTEAVVRLPHAFLPTDGGRPVATDGITRARFGLPEHGFVFCCFNNTHKILPAVFDGWMRMLAAVPGSVFWLREENAPATRNLRAAAAARGIDPARLVMAGRVDAMAEHLGRHALADLFVDTLPYNAHTTAADALQAGLPVLTQAGRAFAGRVAASLLTTLGLPELVTDGAATQEHTAIALARDPARLAAIRARLAAALPATPLFDTPRYARNLERALRAMQQRALAGSPPAGFALDEPGTN
ncbi:glycosyltransferase family 41 protein [Roseomonas sp. CECT 9278]|uniref:O-linked N-acetylglucosamine transferase, SPINDLY family protein n=1 Tax=Roseomonas sp. CECT 9278 TaxID=2845823 RepID=UPI001E3BAA3A|nr:glycosyltransferase family 41 protein [Roseomonas sp. CECT 9278]CAH0144690.1 Lipopolysaccharide assembly protein B [Roseomonas sp. CECT 9278]